MKKIAFLLLASFLFFSCEKEFEQGEDIITTPDLKFTETATNVSVFGGTDGKISVNVTSGMPPYKYKLGNGEFQTASVFENLTAGTYKITVEDGVKKTAFKDIAVTQPAEVIVWPLVFNLSSTNVSSWGLSDGSITTNVTSGMPPYSYSLSNGPTNSTGVFTNILPGNYTVTVTDSRQQTGNKSVVITQPQPVPIHAINSISGKTEISGLNLDFMQNRKSFTISFWYNTPTDQVSQDPAYSVAWLLSTDHSENPVGESHAQVNLAKTNIKFLRGTDELAKNLINPHLGLHHVVILYDGSNMKMYLDNVLLSTVSSTINLNFNKLYLGGHYIHNYYTYNGVISKVKFYNNALTATEVDYLYKN